MLSSDWSAVPGRIARLSVHPDASAVFGSAGHQWRLEPPLSAAELADVQDQLRVDLPAEYQYFLRQVSRGGAGPGYGLFPLVRVDGRWRWEGDGADLTDLTTLGEPFPYTECVNPADGPPAPPSELDFGTSEAYAEALDLYWEQRDAIVYAPHHCVGLLYLCHVGCACRDALVVSGPARGQMWADDTADDGGFRPLLADDGTRMGFAHWYQRWLARAEAHLQRAATGAAIDAPETGR